MKLLGRKVLSTILIGCLMFLSFSTVAYAAEAEGSSEQVIKIMGFYDQTITVKGESDDSSDSARESTSIDRTADTSSAPDDESADAAQQYGRIYLPEGYTDPELTLFHSSSLQEATFERGEDGSYRYAMTPEMLDSPESYKLVVVCNESVFVEKIAAEIHLDDSNLRTLSFEFPEASGVSTAKIGLVDLDDGSYFRVDIPLPAKGSIKLAPCKCTVNLTGTVDGIDINTFSVADVTQGDQTVNISDYVRTYTFQIIGSDEQQFSAQLLAYYSESDVWRLLSMDYAFDAATSSLSCWVDSPVQLADLDEADAAYMLVYASNKAFLVQVHGDNGAGQHIDVSEQQDPVVLDCADLNRVTFTSASDDWTIQQASAQWNGYVLPLSGNEFFLSDGTYDFSVTFESNGVPLVSNMTRDVTEDCVLSIDEAASELRDVTVSWSDAFSQVGAASVRSDTGFSVSDQEFTSGGSLLVEEGPKRWSSSFGAATAPSMWFRA